VLYWKLIQRKGFLRELRIYYLGTKSAHSLSSGHGGSKASLQLLKGSKEKLKRSPSKESIDSTVSVESSVVTSSSATQFDQVSVV